MNNFFQGLIWSHVSETTIIRPGVVFRFSHVNITVTDYAMALGFFKENIRYSIFFMFRNCFDLFGLNFRNVRLKSVNFK